MSFAWYLIIFVGLIAFVYFNELNAKKKVEDYLTRREYRDIKVHTVPFGGARGSLVFDVEYIDRNGRLRHNSCTVHTGLLSEKAIYWESPLIQSEVLEEENE